VDRDRLSILKNTNVLRKIINERLRNILTKKAKKLRTLTVLAGP